MYFEVELCTANSLTVVSHLVFLVSLIAFLVSCSLCTFSRKKELTLQFPETRENAKPVSGTSCQWYSKSSDWFPTSSDSGWWWLAPQSHLILGKSSVTHGWGNSMDLGFALGHHSRKCVSNVSHFLHFNLTHHVAATREVKRTALRKHTSYVPRCAQSGKWRFGQK